MSRQDVAMEEAPDRQEASAEASEAMPQAGSSSADVDIVDGNGDDAEHASATSAASQPAPDPRDNAAIQPRPDPEGAANVSVKAGEVEEAPKGPAPSRKALKGPGPSPSKKRKAAGVQSSPDREVLAPSPVLCVTCLTLA